MKKLKKYECSKCLFITGNKNDFKRHITTLKHQKCMNGVFETQIDHSLEYKCEKCERIFKSRTSIYRHRPRCVSLLMNMSTATATATTTMAMATTTAAEVSNVIIDATDSQIKELVAENKEMKAMMMTMMKHNNDIQKQMFDLYKTSMPISSNSHNVNTSHIINNTNCNNPTFNLNLFLNEQCKDAMNIQEFINSIQLNMTDLENVGKLGYVEGISNIIIDNLQKTDLYKRPVHCSDVKRETLYVKDDNKWEKEGPEHQKMVNAVLAVEHKNIGLMGEWVAAHPKCMDSNTKDNDHYFKLSKTITDGEKCGSLAKVIRRVAKNVVIDKDNDNDNE